MQCCPFIDIRSRQITLFHQVFYNFSVAIPIKNSQHIRSDYEPHYYWGFELNMLKHVKAQDDITLHITTTNRYDFSEMIQ